MAQEKVPAEELAEARKMWAEHVRGVAREPRDPLEPMYAPSSLLTLLSLNYRFNSSLTAVFLCRGRRTF